MEMCFYIELFRKGALVISATLSFVSFFHSLSFFLFCIRIWGKGRS